MQISGINQTTGNNTNFKNAYRVQGVYINGKYFGQKFKYHLYDVSRAFSNALHQGTLSPEVREQVNKYFYDYNKEPYIIVARSCDEVYNQKINILSANDAREYKQLCEVEDDPDVKNWTLFRLFTRNHSRKLILHANQDKNGKITITNIEKVKKEDNKKDVKKK